MRNVENAGGDGIRIYPVIVFFVLSVFAFGSAGKDTVLAHPADAASDTGELQGQVLPVSSEQSLHSIEISLESGWNLISLNVIPVNPSIEYIFADIADNLIYIENERIGLYRPATSDNEIGEWTVTKGYQVYVESNCILRVTGYPVRPEETPIELLEGWNEVAYLPSVPMSVESALASILDRLHLVSNSAGDIFWPEHGINAIGMLQPGQGYRIYMSEPATLVYPSN